MGFLEGVGLAPLQEIAHMTWQDWSGRMKAGLPTCEVATPQDLKVWTVKELDWW